MSDRLYEKTLTRAFRLLAAKSRSVSELRERLREKEWAGEEVVERVIARVQELGYLSDEKFAESFVNSRLSVRPLGRQRLRRELQKRKVSAKVAEQALDEVLTERSEESLIDHAIEKRLRLRGLPSSPVETKKLYDHLLRLGFSYDLVMRKVKQVGKHIDVREED
jgi:regulatory protein